MTKKDFPGYCKKLVEDLIKSDFPDLKDYKISIKWSNRKKRMGYIENWLMSVWYMNEKELERIIKEAKVDSYERGVRLLHETGVPTENELDINLNRKYSDDFIKMNEERLKQNLSHELIHVLTGKEDGDFEFTEKLNDLGIPINNINFMMYNFYKFSEEMNQIFLADLNISWDISRIIEHLNETVFSLIGTDFNYWLNLVPVLEIEKGREESTNEWKK